MESFVIAILVGAGVGFTVGMIVGGRIAGGKAITVGAPYAESGSRGWVGALKQISIALLATLLGAVLGGLVGTVLP